MRPRAGFLMLRCVPASEASAAAARSGRARGAWLALGDKVLGPPFRPSLIVFAATSSCRDPVAVASARPI